MAITSYATLKTAIEAWSHRSDLAAVVDDFIDITESRLNRELRVSQQETVTTLTAVAGLIDLPADFLAIRTVSINSNPVRELHYVSPAEFDKLNSTEVRQYTIVGDKIKLNVAGAADVVVTYYARIEALSDTVATNWVLGTHPEAYLYGCLSEVFKYSMDEEQAAKYAGLYSQSVDQIQRLNRDRKTGQAMRVRAA
jgi:hypothetical protein